MSQDQANENLRIVPFGELWQAQKRRGGHQQEGWLNIGRPGTWEHAASHLETQVLKDHNRTNGASDMSTETEAVTVDLHEYSVNEAKAVPSVEITKEPQVFPEEPVAVRTMFQQVADMFIERSSLRKEVVELRDRVEAMRVDYDTMRRTNQYYAQDIEELREARRKLIEERNALKDRADTLVKENDNLLANYNSAHNDYVSVSAELRDARTSLTAKLEEITGLQATAEEHANAVGQATDAIARLSAENVDWERRHSELTELYTSLRRDYDTAQFQVLELEEKVQQCAEESATLRDRANRAESKLEGIRQAFGNL